MKNENKSTFKKIYDAIIKGKKAHAWLAFAFSGAGCIFFLVLFTLGLIILSYIYFNPMISIDKFLPEFNFSGKENEFKEYQEVDARIKAATIKVMNKYGEFDADNFLPDTALIGATIQEAMDNNNVLAKAFNNELKFGDDAEFVFPTKELLEEMLEAMVLTKITRYCAEYGSDVEGKVYPISYVEELLPIFGQEKPVCEKAGYSFLLDENGHIVEKETKILSTVYYKEAYLYDFFSQNTPELKKTDANGDYLIDLYPLGITPKLTSKWRDETIDLYELYLKYVNDSGIIRDPTINYVNTPSLVSGNFAYSLPLYLCDMQTIRNTTDPTDECRYGAIITSPFGLRESPTKPGETEFHTGVDLTCKQTNPDIYSVMSGTVIKVDYIPIDDGESYGNYVDVYCDTDFDGKEDTLFRYAHLAMVFVNVGDKIGAGEPVGLCGSTGRSTGEHLHFEIRKNGTVVDPINNNGILEKAWQSIFNTEY